MNSIKDRPNIAWFRSVGSMIGAIIGVGVFGLPYAFAQSGLMLGLIELAVIGILMFILQLMFAEVVIQTPGKHRLVGYVEMYLGKNWSYVTTLVFTASVWGAMLAYIIVGGTFLHTLFSPVIGGDPIIYQVIITLLAAALTYRGISILAKIELFIISALIFLFVFIILASVPYMHFENLTHVNFSRALIPYGVIIFAFSGLGIIPEMKHMLGEKDKHKLPRAVAVGAAIIMLVYALFATVVVGVTGLGTTESAFSGLVPIVGGLFAVVGALLGSITITSIFSILAVELQGVFRFDYKMPLYRAWLLSLIVPIVLFVLGVREFIEIIGFVGAILGGIIGVIVIFTYEKMRRSPVCKTHYCLQVPKAVSIVLVVILLSGAILEAFSLLS